jgi:hypothetical protein
MAMAVTLADRMTASPDVVFRALGGEAIVLSLDGGVYFGLDEVGTRIWQLLESHDLAGIAAALAGEYDVDRSVVEGDVVAFVETLMGKGLVRRTG